MNLNLGPFAALIGAVVLAIGFALLFKSPRTVSLEVIAWTVTIGLLAVVSENVAPSPRILLTAFPAVLVFAYYCAQAVHLASQRDQHVAGFDQRADVRRSFADALMAPDS